MAVFWHYQLYGIVNWENPEVLEIWRYVARASPDFPFLQDFTFLFYKDPLWTDMQVEVISVNVTVDSFNKHTRISFLDTVTGERVYYDDYCSVPPANGQIYSGDLLHSQVHTVEYPVEIPSTPIAPPPRPPEPILPPVGPPVVVEIQPPDQPPQPVEPPPEGPPPEHPPQQPPWRPPEKPPPISPRETDRDTFISFMDKWGHQIDWYSVNVPLDGGEWVEDLEEPYRSLWARLTQHKADLVFERRGTIYVAEIKPRLSRGAIGEAFIAEMMYRRVYKPTKPTKAAVICMTASPLLLQYAGHAGVLVFVTHAIDGTPYWGEVRIRHKMR